MHVHVNWLIVRAEEFWHFPFRFYDSKLAYCENFSKIGWLEIPFAKCVFEPLKCNTAETQNSYAYIGFNQWKVAIENPFVRVTKWFNGLGAQKDYIDH